MLPIFVVNNFGQFNHLILRMLLDLDIDAKMVPNTMPPNEVACRCRGIVLGGGPDIARSGNSGGYLHLGLPVLGICLGLHVIAREFSGTVTKGRLGGYGRSGRYWNSRSCVTAAASRPTSKCSTRSARCSTRSSPSPRRSAITSSRWCASTRRSAAAGRSRRKADPGRCAARHTAWPPRRASIVAAPQSRVPPRGDVLRESS